MVTRTRSEAACRSIVVEATEQGPYLPPAVADACAHSSTTSPTRQAATCQARGWLPGLVSSVANSASGWTFMAALLALASHVPARGGAALGAVVFVLLVLGYTLVSQARGFAYSPVRWSAIGIVAGPLVGVATTWLRERDHRAALGTMVLAGIGIG